MKIVLQPSLQNIRASICVSATCAICGTNLTMAVNSFGDFADA